MVVGKENIELESMAEKVCIILKSIGEILDLGFSYETTNLQPRFGFPTRACVSMNQTKEQMALGSNFV